MLLATKIIDGIEWQLWKTANPHDRILGPRYLVKKYPDGKTKLSAWGIGSAQSEQRTEPRIPKAARRNVSRHRVETATQNAHE